MAERPMLSALPDSGGAWLAESSSESMAASMEDKCSSPWSDVDIEWQNRAGYEELTGAYHRIDRAPASFELRDNSTHAERTFYFQLMKIT
jgi:hypothetical protein